MIAENRGTKALLDELLGADGAAFSLRDPGCYNASGELASFFELGERVALSNEVLCGYLLAGGDGKTVVNPRDKSLRKLWTGVELVVLASR